MAVLADIQDGVLQEDVCCSSAARGLSFLGRPLLRGGSLGSRGSAAHARLSRACVATANAQERLSVGFKSSATRRLL